MSSNRPNYNIKTPMRNIASPAKSPTGITIRSVGSKTQKARKAITNDSLTQPTKS